MVVVVVARGQEGPGERRGWLEVVAQLTDCAVTPELPQSSLTRHSTRTPSPPGRSVSGGGGAVGVTIVLTTIITILCSS